MIYLRRFTDRLIKFWFPVLVLSVLAVSVAYAKSVAVMKERGITVLLTDEPCDMPEVSNLPYKLTWTQEGKTYKGCFSVHGGIVVTYTEDKAVGLIPGQLFKPLTDS